MAIINMASGKAKKTTGGGVVWVVIVAIFLTGYNGYVGILFWDLCDNDVQKFE